MTANIMDKSNRHRNIFIIGPQCTGKTTLVNALQTYFYSEKCTTSGHGSKVIPNVISEVARTVLVNKNFTRDDITTSPVRALELQRHILDAQIEAENSFQRRYAAEHWYISDRSGLDPIVYARVFVGEEASHQLLALPTWIQLEKNMKDGLVVLCESGCDWLHDDGTRLMPKDMSDWKILDLAFQQLLEDRDIQYVVISKDQKDITQRVRTVLNALMKLDRPQSLDP